MADMTAISLFSVLILVLLFLCWRALRQVASRISRLSERIDDFLEDYEKVNDFTEKKALAEEIARAMAAWQDQKAEK